MQQGSGNRRWLFVGMGLGLAVVVAAAVVVFVVLDRDGVEAGSSGPSSSPGRPSGEPGEAPQPEVDVARRTLDYLAGEGAPAVAMHRAAGDLGARPTAEQCQRVGAALDRDVPPDQLVLVIEGVPDEVLRDSLSGERDSLGVTLTACAQGEQPTYEREAPLPDAVRLVQARLDELAALR